MRDTLIALLKLQKIDSDTLEIEHEAQRIPEQIQSLEQEVDKLRVEVGRLNAEADQQRRELTEMEGNVSEESAKHQKWKRRLNDIKSPREYQALSRELEMGERQVHEMEDKLLELTQHIEDAQKAIDEKQAHLRDKEVQVRSEVQSLRRSEADLRSRAVEASAGRAEAAGDLNSRVLKRYEQLRANRGGVAVAQVVDGTCTGCRMKVRPQQVVHLLRADSMETCPSCNRILVHEAIAAEAFGPDEDASAADD